MRPRTVQNGVKIVPERFVGQIGPNIDELHGEPF
jgi:hypothetical protein